MGSRRYPKNAAGQSEKSAWRKWYSANLGKKEHKNRYRTGNLCLLDDTSWKLCQKKEGGGLQGGSGVASCPPTIPS